MAPRWMGRCSSCGGWNTLVEEVVTGSKRSRNSAPNAFGASSGKPVAIAEVAEDAAARLPTGIEELDRVLGGGAVLLSLIHI